MTSASTSWDEASEVDSGWQLPTHAEEIARLPQRPLRLDDEAACLHGEVPADDEVVIQISPRALADITAHATSDMTMELGGVLLGRAGRVGERLHVEIDAALPAHSSDHGPIHFTFTADAWSRIHRERAEHFENMPIVGWFHTHPDLGVFFSNDDVVVHTAAFVMPWHVALVVDPVREEAAFFGWRSGEPAPVSGYYEMLEEAPVSRLPWRTVPGHVWAVSEAELAAPDTDATAQNDSPVRRAPWHDDWRLPAAGGILALLLLVWLAALQMETRALRNVATGLAAQSLAAANESGAASCVDSRLQIVAPLPGATVLTGSRTAVVGTTAWPGASRYEIAVRHFDGDGWITIGRPWRDTNFGRIATWDTSDFAPGVYEMRLLALDRSGASLSGSVGDGGGSALAAALPLGCTIRLQLIEATR